MKSSEPMQRKLIQAYIKTIQEEYDQYTSHADYRIGVGSLEIAETLLKQADVLRKELDIWTDILEVQYYGHEMIHQNARLALICAEGSELVEGLQSIFPADNDPNGKTFVWSNKVDPSKPPLRADIKKGE